MRHRLSLTTVLALLVSAVLLLAALLAAPGNDAAAAPAEPAAPATSQSAQRWANATTATITPGVQMYTDGAQCTANFVFTDAQARVYVGYAAHCAASGGATDTNGCGIASLPLGTAVRFGRGGTVAGGEEIVGSGTLAYSSWREMTRRGTRDSNTCEANDFALVRVGATHVRKVNPSVPFWGGPTSTTASGPPAAGQQVFSYGSSSLRPTDLLSPKTGLSLGPTFGGWGFNVYTATPGVPGDSGSGVLDARGRAAGTLSTVAFVPTPASNGIGSLSRELSYAQRTSGIAGLRLVAGTEPFNPAP